MEEQLSIGELRSSIQVIARYIRIWHYFAGGRKLLLTSSLVLLTECHIYEAEQLKTRPFVS